MTEPTHRPARRRRVALLAAVAAPVALAAIPAALSAAPTIATDAICLRPIVEPNGPGLSPPLNISGIGLPAEHVDHDHPGRADRTSPSRTRAALLPAAQRASTACPHAAEVEPAGHRGGRPGVRRPSNALRIRTAPLEFEASPKRTRPSNTVTFRFSGFNPDQVDLRPLPLQRARAGQREDGAGPATRAACSPRDATRSRSPTRRRPLAAPVRPQQELLAHRDAAHPRDGQRLPHLPLGDKAAAPPGGGAGRRSPRTLRTEPVPDRRAARSMLVGWRTGRPRRPRSAPRTEPPGGAASRCWRPSPRPPRSPASRRP